MKRLIRQATLIAAAAIMAACAPKAPRAKYVVLLGFDAMGSYGIQRAETPAMNRMISEGAFALNTRCVRETSSSQNWMSMISAACIEHHGVFGNAWEPDNAPIEPTIKNECGFFPTIFDHIREQRPDARAYGYCEWKEEGRMYNLGAPHRWVGGLNDSLTIAKAFEDYYAERPEFLFLSIDKPDHMGHVYGHESEEYLQAVSEADRHIGEFVEELRKRGWLDDTVIIVTGDHGGIRYGHGGDSPQELTTAVLLYGGPVTKGTILKHGYMIYDVGATIAALMGINLPPDCNGHLIKEAFEPATGIPYTPVPFIRKDFKAETGETMVSISADCIDPVTVRYTLDASDPTEESPVYEGPFSVTESCVVKAASFKDGHRSFIGESVVLMQGSGAKKVAYKYYAPYHGSSVPDFGKIGRAAHEGFITDFNIRETCGSGKDHFAIQFSSKIMAPVEGTYRFGLFSDDGAKLYVDGILVSDNDGSHSAGKIMGKITLSPGVHSIRVDYFEDYMGEELELTWVIPGQGERPIFPSDLMM